MTQAIAERIAAFRNQRRVQAGSLIVTVFGDAILPRGGRIWLGSLIRLLEPLGISERLVRTAVFRLTRDEWLTTEVQGRRSDYLLTAAGRRRISEASRDIYASHAPLWDRRWRLILLVRELPPKVRDQLRRALFWQGFGAPGNDCFVHPGADLSAAISALAAEGLASTLGSLMPLLAADARLGMTASDTELVQRAWDLDTLARAYQEFEQAHMPILADLRRGRFAELAPQDALLARILLIHDYRRLLLRDPQLPDVLLPRDWPGQSARLLCRELYRRLVVPSERHLDDCMRLADDSCPALDPSLPERFAADDPLVAIAA